MFRLWRDAVCISEQMPSEMQKPGVSELFLSLSPKLETLAAAMGIKYEKSLKKKSSDIYRFIANYLAVHDVAGAFV